MHWSYCSLVLLHRYHKCSKSQQNHTWWCYQMETFSTLMALCAGNSPVTGEFPEQRPVSRNFEVLFDLCLNKPLSKQSRGWWSETHKYFTWCFMSDCLLCRTVSLSTAINSILSWWHIDALFPIKYVLFVLWLYHQSLQMDLIHLSILFRLHSIPLGQYWGNHDFMNANEVTPYNMGKINHYWPTTKQSKAQTMCIF